MNNVQIVLTAMRNLGRSDALSLRQRADAMTGTEIIAAEHSVPQWSSDKDYTTWPVGAPVQYNGQVYKLLQPHNAAHYPGDTPEIDRALWGLCHTTDPAAAKPYIAPLGTSGLYYKDECCMVDGNVYRCIVDSTDHSPTAWPEGWENLTENEEETS